MKFKDFIHKANKLKLSTSEYKVVDIIATNYIDKYQSKTEQEITKISTKLSRSVFERLFLNPKDKNLSPRYIHIGEYPLSDRKTGEKKHINVFLITNLPSVSTEGVHNEDTDEVFLFHDVLKTYFKQDVYTVVSHEIVHAVQHYKDVSDAYRTEVAKDVPGPKYYIEPKEFEASISGIVNSLYNISNEYTRLAKKYLELNDFGLVKLYTKKHKLFINDILTFIKTPFVQFSRLSIKNTPSVIFNNLAFFEALSTSPVYSKRYRILLYKAANDMEREFSKLFQKTA